MPLKGRKDESDVLVSLLWADEGWPFSFFSFLYVVMPVVCGRRTIGNGDRRIIFDSLIKVRELGF